MSQCQDSNSKPPKILCPWCRSSYVDSAPMPDRGAGMTHVDKCRCNDCGRTFTVRNDD